MARQKSEQVRVAIMGAAERLFMEKGYIATTISSIARAAGTSQSNVYVYFDSKFEIAFAVFDPWLRTRIAELEATVSAQKTPEDSLHALIHGLLHGIAADRSGQTLTLVQALATAKPGDDYNPELLIWTMSRIHHMIGRALPDLAAAEREAMTHSLMLAFDGIALRQNLRRGEITAAASVDALEKMVLALVGRRAATDA
ncbi:TetR/AcrR family transcriptional regulator [Pseudooceanicola atlanticus]|uniref:TetR/AcrR family transcriptional regulator n=1 Tax=Pseudooceanicola atlanticus TaxID=1461694 RepID=UPI00069334C0|nr:TetR/AcrR family transcriptional regulator [Pseudooceanicola atlanticus]